MKTKAKTPKERDFYEELGTSEVLTPVTIETTQGSILHRLMTKPSGELRSPLTAYVIAVVTTFVPLASAAAITALTTPAQRVSPRLPFHLDWNVMCMFLISFPTLIVLIVTDDSSLRKALHRIQIDGIVTFFDIQKVRDTLVAWKKRFRRANLAAYAAGVLGGVLVAIANFRTYTPSSVGFWIARENKLLPVGYVFLVCIFLFYAAVSILVVRSITISLFLRELVKHARLSMLPAHPDNCGGLRPIGGIGLRNQYALTVCGVNVALLGIVSYLHLDLKHVEGLEGLIVAAIVAYVVLGPLIFLGPLMTFRHVMLATKSELLSEVARRLRVELRRLREALPKGQITKEDEEFVDRLRKIGGVIDELPVWPFDSGTLKKFVTAYMIPLVGGVGFVLSKIIEEFIKSYMAHGK